MVFKKEPVKMHKKNYVKRGNVVNKLKSGWEAPDGGWGWVIVAASGFAHFFFLSFLVSFGLVFRQRLQKYGISSSQTATLINVHAAVQSFVGLANGPIYRKYTFRKIACVGGFLCSSAIFALAFTTNFYGMLFFFSVMHAIGVSFLSSSNTLIVINYFIKRRRLAIGLLCVICGFANMTIPQLTTVMMSFYGMSGAIILLSGITLQTIVCAVLLQPVQMNAKKKPVCKNTKPIAEDHDEKSTDAVINESTIIISIENPCNRDKNNDQIKNRLSQRLGVRNIYKNDKENELEIPLMIFTDKNRISRENNDIDNRKRKNSMDTNMEAEVDVTNTSGNSDNVENHANNGYEIVQENNKKMEYPPEESLSLTCRKSEDQEQKKLSRFQEVIEFLDLDILRDCACVNLIISVSIVSVIEINFSLLMPFILADYGLTINQVALILSILGGVDVIVRLTISMVGGFIRWENRTCMIIGVVISALGHSALAHVKTYAMILGIAMICSFGKAMCLIFSTLVLPDHVSLDKLPAATGLQLMFKGIIFLAFGPTFGWLRQISGSYTIPLHFMNIIAYYVIISKIIEKWLCIPKKNRAQQIK